MIRNIYIVCFTVGGLYSLLSFLFGHVFDFDFDFHFDLGSFLLPLKPSVIMVFAAVFGGAGLLALHYMPPTATLLAAVPSGALAATALYRLVYIRLKRYETRAVSEDDTIMQQAEVVERIAPGGYGKISFVINGNTISGAAKEKKPGNGIQKGSKVYILDSKENTYYVCEDLELYTKNLINKMY